MKIGIACYPTYGGSGVVASELGLSLLERGHEVHVISYELPFRLYGFVEDLYFHKIDVINYPLFKYPPFTLAAACKMIEIAECVKLDVLHVHYTLPWAVCAHLAREVVAESCGRLKIVTTLHGTDVTLVGAEPALFKMTKFGIERSDAVTAVSFYLADEARNTFAVMRPIDVIYNAVDYNRFNTKRKKGYCRKYFAPEGTKILIHCSNFRPVKNVLDAVRAFALVKKAIPAKLLMLGEGPDLPSARALANELDIADDISFLGNQDAVEEILPCGDLFLFPSKYEGFGLAALEAMSCGLPVIATNTGGLVEVVTQGEDGWLTEEGDYEGMAEKSIQLLSDNQRLNAMSEAARNKAINKFSPESIVPQYEAVYERVCSPLGC